MCTLITLVVSFYVCRNYLHVPLQVPCLYQQKYSVVTFLFTMEVPPHECPVCTPVYFVNSM